MLYNLSPTSHPIVMQNCPAQCDFITQCTCESLYCFDTSSRGARPGTRRGAVARANRIKNSRSLTCAEPFMCGIWRHVSWVLSADIFDSASCEAGARGHRARKKRKSMCTDNTTSYLKKIKKTRTKKFCSSCARIPPPFVMKHCLQQSVCARRARRKQREPIKHKRLNGVIHQVAADDD